MSRKTWVRLLAVTALSLLALGLAGCDAPMTTTDPRSDTGERVQTLYQLVFWLAVVVFIGVMIASIWFTLQFREGARTQASQFHGNSRLEVIWTLIPVIIVVVIAVPTFDTIFATSENREVPDALEVEVIGHQWWFEFRYPSLGIVTANEFHLPDNTTVHFRLRSELAGSDGPGREPQPDVAHSFWVPQFGGKMDVIPGHENNLIYTVQNAARPEAYLGQCYEFCGASHANMRFRVFVDTQSDFDAWVATMQSDRKAPSGEAAAGEAVFLRQSCIGCHTVEGTAAAGRAAPNLTHVGSRTTLAAGIMENTPENMAKWIRDSGSIKPGSKMPAFPQNQLSDQDLQAIVAYLQSLD